MTSNTLFRPSNKFVFGLMFKGALLGMTALVLAYVTFWTIKNWKAVVITVSYPDVVADLKIETKLALKK